MEKKLDPEKLKKVKQLLEASMLEYRSVLEEALHEQIISGTSFVETGIDESGEFYVKNVYPRKERKLTLWEKIKSWF